MTKGKQPTGLQVRDEMDGTEPVTSYDSKQVMLAAERRDTIQLVEVVENYSEDVELPEKFTVNRRVSTYYGPELILYANQNGHENYLLNARGPDMHLSLWRANIDDKDRRRSYSIVAEVKAALSEDNSYKLCPDCGKPFKSIEHERAAAIGECPNMRS